jgi:hypothetical protein
MQLCLGYKEKMQRAKHLTLYLNDHQQQQLAEGRAGMVGLVKQSVEQAGWQTAILHDTESHLCAAKAGYHLMLNKPVPGPNAAVLRKCYLDPFWRIEPTNDRWDWEVSGLDFEPARINPERAAAFLDRWRTTLFKDTPIADQGHIFMPLQGKLTTRRHFQAQSPADMILTTLKSDPERQVLATLHPGEVYTKGELDRLAQIEQAHPRFHLSSLASMDLLAGCSYVVTQNSGLALKGFFAKKPAVLFARIDFHHIAGVVPQIGPAGAFRHVRTAPPAFDAYVQWFFKWHAITVWSDSVMATIQARLRTLGWPI